MSLPPYTTRDEVQRRLHLIFPEGTPDRTYAVREITASTVFALLYIGAVDGTSRYAAPKHVYRMTDEQAARTSDAQRLSYLAEAQKAGFVPDGKPWYADTTREPIRDEALRQGLLPVGAVVDRKDIPTTSSKPRWALAADFAALFDPSLAGDALETAMAKWRSKHLTQSARAKIALYQSGAVDDATGVSVELPNGSVRKLAAGQSSTITKYVIEEFATRFLVKPAVVWLSESRKHVVVQDELLAKSLGLTIDASRNLPDIILADAGREETLLVFVEVVATDGPVSEERRKTLLAIATEGGHDEKNVAFVTAFLDRGHAAFKKTFASLAWNSFAWVASDPQNIIALLDLSAASSRKLHDILALHIT